MLTKAMRVRELFPDHDWKMVTAIAIVNGMGDYTWPRGCWGCIAELDGHPVAFAAGRDINDGLVIEDIWAVPGPDGLRGISSLGEWIEGIAERLARAHKKSVRVSGVVFPHNERHAKMLQRRGYTEYATVYSKEFTGVE